MYKYSNNKTMTVLNRLGNFFLSIDLYKIPPAYHLTGKQCPQLPLALTLLFNQPKIISVM